MYRYIETLCLALLTGTLVVSASAAEFTPTQTDLTESVDNTTGFGGGGALTSNTADSGGALYTVSFDPNSNGPGNPGFTRVAIQKASFDADLSAFDSFDVIITNVSGVTGVKMFVQTGVGFAFFETPFTSLTEGVATTLSLDLTGLPDTDNVRQFGFQFFGGPDASSGNQVLIQPVPEPGSLAAVGATGFLILMRRRRSPRA